MTARNSMPVLAECRKWDMPNKRSMYHKTSRPTRRKEKRAPRESLATERDARNTSREDMKTSQFIKGIIAGATIVLIVQFAMSPVVVM